jgi:hypothetical protein
VVEQYGTVAMQCCIVVARCYTIFAQFYTTLVLG